MNCSLDIERQTTVKWDTRKKWNIQEFWPEYLPPIFLNTSLEKGCLVSKSTQFKTKITNFLFWSFNANSSRLCPYYVRVMCTPETSKRTQVASKYICLLLKRLLTLLEGANKKFLGIGATLFVGIQLRKYTS